MIILGLNYAFHDSSACIVRNGQLACAVEDERFTGDKHTQSFPLRAIQACLASSGTDPKDVDHIAVSFDPRHGTFSKLAHALRLGTRMPSYIRYEFLRLRERQAAFRRWYERTWAERVRQPEVHYVEHHLAHVGGSYFVSPFDDAALLSVDGWGEWDTTWLGEATGPRLRHFGSSGFPHSLGCFYSAATEFCGFQPNYDEGKTMGLAPTGDPTRFYPAADKLVDVDEDGRLFLDLAPFCFAETGGRFCGPSFYERFGAPRLKEQPIEARHCDVAAAFQKVLEEKVLALCRVLERKSRSRNLVLAGGVALNSVANGRVSRETRFDQLYVMPGAGDNGTSIGAAFYVYNHKLGAKDRYHHGHGYVGNEYDDDQIERVLREGKVRYRRSENICDDVAQQLRSGKIVAWFQGKMEFGPRALGNRSILADPTSPSMKDRINAEVKHREAFRPFAPSVTVEDTSSYFDFQGESPFMLMVCDVRDERRALLPAITHVDGTARLQTVSRDANPLYYALIRAFERRSGVPVLLNTSFNVMGEPIVKSPLRAIQCFFSTGLDVLAIGNFVVDKEAVPAFDSSLINIGTGRPVKGPAHELALTY